MTGGEPLRPSAVDLFCGAGGLTAALEAAGFDTIAAVDHDRDSIRTLQETQAARVRLPRSGRTYLQGARLVHADICGVSAAALRPDGSGRDWRPDVLAGGPPCQPFSSAGRQGALRDPRGVLFLEFVRLAAELRPRLILFENVAGLVTARCDNGRPGGVLELIQRSFEDIGYACRFQLLNAADFGAPQRRVRLFMLASCAAPLPEFPNPTHSRDDARLKPWVTLGNFLASQPPALPEDIVRPSGLRAHDLDRLLPGTGLKSRGIVEANRPSGHWGYRQDSFLADPGLPARTIRAASTPDWIRLPDQSLRRLTWRECAALQGFPPGWRFQGTVASRFRQIGNAVQGSVGRAIAEVLASAADSPHAYPLRSAPWPASFLRRVRYTESEQVVNGGHRLAAKRSREESSEPIDGRDEPAQVVRRRA